MKKLVFTFINIFSFVFLFAQDKQFTQFYSSPLTLNPALSGVFDGKYRVGAVYRDQWRGLLDQPYQTFSFGADLRLEPFRGTKDRVGAGLLFYRDKINSLDFSTTQLGVSGAYHKSLDYNKSEFLSLGVQIGLTQRNINYEGLTFQEQWNGVTGYTLPRSERLPENNFGYNDFSTGLNYSVSPSPRFSFFSGLSVHHFNRPNVAFFKGEELPKIPLYMRYGLQLAAQFPINKDYTVYMSPRLMATMQGPHITANVGTNFRIRLDKTYNTNLHIGSWVRPVKNKDAFSVDAVVLMTGFEFNHILLGLSYDLNIPNLKNYRRTQNVFELSLVYLGEYDNDQILCPSF